jgi:hypothetical protein
MELPEFYNIALERPVNDAAGYDVMFVEVRPRSEMRDNSVHIPSLF